MFTKTEDQLNAFMWAFDNRYGTHYVSCKCLITFFLFVLHGLKCRFYPNRSEHVCAHIWNACSSFLMGEFFEEVEKRWKKNIWRKKTFVGLI